MTEEGGKGLPVGLALGRGFLGGATESVGYPLLPFPGEVTWAVPALWLSAASRTLSKSPGPM